MKKIALAIATLGLSISAFAADKTVCGFVTGVSYGGSEHIAISLTDAKGKTVRLGTTSLYAGQAIQIAQAAGKQICILANENGAIYRMESK